LKHILIFLVVGGSTVLLADEIPAGVKIDNEKVKVTVATEQVHRPGPQHEHVLNRVMVYLGDGELTYTNANGKVDKIRFKKGDVGWAPAAKHVSENTSDHVYQMVEVDIKTKAPSTPPKLSSIDPLKVDPKHYKLEFENDQVRVVRVRFGPKEKGVEHEHSLDHLVVYLNDQGRGKFGEVRFDPPMKHTEENALDQAVERIAIDIK